MRERIENLDAVKREGSIADVLTESRGREQWHWHMRQTIQVVEEEDRTFCVWPGFAAEAAREVVDLHRGDRVFDPLFRLHVLTPLLRRFYRVLQSWEKCVS